MTTKTIPFHRRQTVLIMGTTLTTRCASFIFIFATRRLTCNQSEYPNNVLRYRSSGFNPYPLTFSHDTQIHQRCESSAINTGSTTSSCQTSPATSPSVHLPLATDYFQQQSYSRPPTADSVVQAREGFSSAFELISLDDSEVLAGLGEGTPFFDNAITNGSSSHNPSWGDGPTPRANPCDAPPANGKKRAHQQQQQQDTFHGQAGIVPAGTLASLKELKEIWKQNVKTPFSGQALAHGHQQQANRTNNTQPDNLRSYEQAVLARRAPITLHLAPRRRSHTTSTGPPVTHPSPPPAFSTTAPLPGKGNRTSPTGSGSGSDRSMSALTDDRGGSYASMDMDSLTAR